MIKLIFLFILVSCQNSEGTKIFADFDKEHRSAEMACRTYEEFFVKKSFTEDGPEDFPYQFVKDEKAALKAIGGYNLDILDHSRIVNYETLLFKHCDLNSKTGDMGYYCPDSVTHYTFFKALLTSIKIEKWSDSTKKKAFDLIRKYLVKENDQATGLVTRGLLLNLLKIMAADGIIDKKHILVIEQATADFDREMEIIRNRKFVRECKSMSANFNTEMKASEVFRNRIQEILTSI